MDGIRPGRDFVEVLDEQLEQCDALLAIIGKDWCSLLNKDGQRRLDAPNDLVRIEIEQALKRKAFVLPVLVDDAAMPTIDELPPSIHKIANLQNVEIRNRHFDYHVEELIKVLTEALEDRAKARLIEAENARIASETRLRELEATRRLKTKLAEQAEDAERLAEERLENASTAARLTEQKQSEAASEAKRLAEVERLKLQEAERFAAEQRDKERAALLAEERKREEAAKLAEGQRKQAEAARAAEELRKQAEAALVAEERKREEAAKQAEEQQKPAKAARIAEELRKQAEAALAAEERRQAEAAALAEAHRKQAEAERLAEEQREKAEAEHPNWAFYGTPTGFWSFTASDETSSRGKLDELRALFAARLQQQVGRSQTINFQVTGANPPGHQWDQQMREAIENSSFLIPIVTPGFLRSEWCCRVVTLFQKREAELGIRNLVFPIHYIDVDKGAADCFDPAVLAFLRTRAWTDFRQLRFRPQGGDEIAAALEDLARSVLTALVETTTALRRAEVERQAKEAEAQRTAETKRRRAGAARAADEARQRSDAEKAESAAAQTKRQIDDALRFAEEKRRQGQAAASETGSEAIPIGEDNRTSAHGLSSKYDDHSETFLTSEITQALIGNKSQFYIKKWRTMIERTGFDNRMPTTARSWMFAPLLFPPAWLFYRKLYIKGISFFVILVSVELVTLFNLFSSISQYLNNADWIISLLACFWGPAFYFDDIRKKYKKVKDERLTLEEAKKLGGTNLPLAVIITLCFFMIVCGLVYYQMQRPDVEQYEKAAESGDADAMFNLGATYYNGQGVTQDYAKAREWYQKAATAGYTDAMNNLGSLYDNGQGVSQDYAKAREWYQKAADAGNANAMFNLGATYYNGQGVTQDYAKAREWYEKGAEAGSALAIINLGALYADGQGVPQDFAKAREWFEKGAAAGSAQATYNLGVLYTNGQGVSQDFAKARELYEKAATAGYADAMNNLGALYDNGQGVSQDYAKAREWYQKAADAGNAKAMVNLGALYVNGQGGLQDYAKARELFYKSAAADSATAMKWLAYLYANGLGVAKDQAQADQWTAKAKAAPNH